MSGLDGPEKFFWLLQKSWSDKVSLLHIKGTQREGEHGGAEGTKSDRGVVYVLLMSLVINVFNKFCKPLLWNAIDQSINKTRKYPLMLHAPMLPQCSPISLCDLSSKF